MGQQQQPPGGPGPGHWINAEGQHARAYRDRSWGAGRHAARRVAGLKPPRRFNGTVAALIAVTIAAVALAVALVI